MIQLVFTSETSISIIAADFIAIIVGLQLPVPRLPPFRHLGQTHVSYSMTTDNGRFPPTPHQPISNSGCAPIGKTNPFVNEIAVCQPAIFVFVFAEHRSIRRRRRLVPGKYKQCTHTHTHTCTHVISLWSVIPVTTMVAATAVIPSESKTLYRRPRSNAKNIKRETFCRRNTDGSRFRGGERKQKVVKPKQQKKIRAIYSVFFVRCFKQAQPPFPNTPLRRTPTIFIVMYKKLNLPLTRMHHGDVIRQKAFGTLNSVCFPIDKNGQRAYRKEIKSLLL